MVIKIRTSLIKKFSIADVYQASVEIIIGRFDIVLCLLFERQQNDV